MPSSLDQSACDLSTLDGLVFSQKNPVGSRSVRIADAYRILDACRRSRVRSHARRRMVHRRRRAPSHGLFSRCSPDSRTMQARRSRCRASICCRIRLTSSYFYFRLSLIALSNQSPEPTTIGAFRDSARVAGCWMSIVRGGSAPNVRGHKSTPSSSCAKRSHASL